MIIDRKGCTRLVFIFHTFVIKIPNCTYSWYNFLCGLICNMNEANLWRWNSGQYETGKSHLLCPVIWSALGGFFLIQQRASILTDDEFHLADLSSHIAHFPGDDKAQNYGVIHNRIVKVDYGS